MEEVGGVPNKRGGGYIQEGFPCEGGGSGGRCIIVREGGEVEYREATHGGASGIMKKVQFHYMHEEEVGDLWYGKVKEGAHGIDFGINMEAACGAIACRNIPSYFWEGRLCCGMLQSEKNLYPVAILGGTAQYFSIFGKTPI